MKHFYEKFKGGYIDGAGHCSRVATGMAVKIGFIEDIPCDKIALTLCEKVDDGLQIPETTPWMTTTVDPNAEEVEEEYYYYDDDEKTTTTTTTTTVTTTTTNADLVLDQSELLDKAMQPLIDNLSDWFDDICDDNGCFNGCPPKTQKAINSADKQVATFKRKVKIDIS